MSSVSDCVTVYRSMSANAREEAETVLNILVAEGLPAIELDDSTPGMPDGTVQVRVPASVAAQAEKLIAENRLPEKVDDPANLELETIFHAEGSSTAEVEALTIKNLLESNGIAAAVVGDSVLPNLPFEVKVARDQVKRAQQLIAEAQTTGPAAAEVAEQEFEREVETLRLQACGNPVVSEGPR